MARPHAGRARPGQWVEIHRVLFQPGERAPQVPPETASVPLEMRVRGFLQGESFARPGDGVTIRTLSGRAVEGTLGETDPAYTHTFGRPVPELMSAGEELSRAL